MLAVIVGLVAAEAVLPAAVESTVEDRAAERLAPVGDVRADLGTFPVVARVLVEGEVPSLVVVAEDLRRGGVTFAELTVTLEGIVVARRHLLDGDVELERIDRGRLTASIAEAELERRIPGTDVTLAHGSVAVTVGGQRLTAEVAVSEGTLRLAAPGLPAAFVSLPSSGLFPCELAARAVPGALELSCRLDRVPDWLVRHLSRQAAAAQAAVGHSEARMDRARSTQRTPMPALS